MGKLEGFTPPVGTSFTLIHGTGNVTGQFAGLAEGSVFTEDGVRLQITYQGGSDQDDVVVTTVAPSVSILGAPTTSPAGTPINLSANVNDPLPIGTEPGLTYSWSATENGASFAASSAATFSFTPDIIGSYAVALTVTDNADGSALASVPSISVTPAAFSLSQSLVAAAPSSFVAGGSSTITLTPKDPFGNLLPTGITTVAFSLATGTSGGTVGSAVLNANGTYTASFTSTTAGSDTITTTINSQTVTSTAPTITVTPAAFSLSQSLVAAPPSSFVAGGSSTITLTPKDTFGNLLPTGITTVAFSLAAGSSGGTVGSVTHNTNGTYTASLTSTTAGSDTIITSIDSQTVTSTAPTITVTPAAFNLSQSLVAAAPTSFVAGGSSTITLTPKDQYGNLLPTGITTVAFSLATGSSGGTVSSATLNTNGTYTAGFTSTTAGSDTITTTINGQSVTSTAPTISVISATAATSYNFAFNTASFPAAETVGGITYTSVPGSAYTTAKGYGWTTAINSLSRGTPTSNPVYEALNFSSNATFRVDLPDGIYTITATMGDAASLHDDDDILTSVGGGTFASVLGGNLVGNAAGQWTSTTFTVNVNAGNTLSLQFLDRGGVDPNFVLNALQIQPSTGPTGVQNIAIALTSAGSNPANDPNDLTTAANGSSIDVYTGTIAGASRAGDSITLSTTLGTIVGVDNGSGGFVADGNSQITGLQAIVEANNTFKFEVMRPTLAGTAPVFTATDVTGAAVGTLTGAVYTVPKVRQLAFIPTGAAVTAPILPVLLSSVYATTGYGWTTTPLALTRGGAPAGDTTEDSFHFDSISDNFQVQVAPDTQYTVRVYIYDSLGAHDADVTVGSSSLAVASTAGVLQDPVFTVTSTGSAGGPPVTLSINMQQFGSVSPDWVLNGLDIVQTVGGTPPTLQPELAANVIADSKAPSLTQAELAPIAAAIQRLAATGLSAAQVAELKAITYVIQPNLAATTGALGLTALNSEVVTLDATGAGHGWFIDPTPTNDDNFRNQVSTSKLLATNPAATTGYDLLTVVMHEDEHVLGVSDVSAAVAPNVLMTNTLAVGMRRLPTLRSRLTRDQRYDSKPRVRVDGRLQAPHEPASRNGRHSRLVKGIDDAERGILGEQLGGVVFLHPQLSIFVTDEVIGEIHRFKRYPAGFGEAVDALERGVLPEQLSIFKVVQLETPLLVAQVRLGKFTDWKETWSRSAKPWVKRQDASLRSSSELISVMKPRPSRCRMYAFGKLNECREASCSFLSCALNSWSTGLKPKMSVANPADTMVRTATRRTVTRFMVVPPHSIELD